MKLRDRRKYDRSITKCGPTKKVCFKTHEAALQRGGEIISGPNARAKAFRAYKCHYCGQFHLSQTV